MICWQSIFWENIIYNSPFRFQCQLFINRSLLYKLLINLFRLYSDMNVTAAEEPLSQMILRFSLIFPLSDRCLICCGDHFTECWFSFSKALIDCSEMSNIFLFSFVYCSLVKNNSFPAPQIPCGPLFLSFYNILFIFSARLFFEFEKLSFSVRNPKRG